ncbi:MAG: phospholipase [Gemmatimonadaceae bacterium]
MSTERHIEVSRTARFHMEGEPGPRVKNVWFVCHGYGQLAADFIREFDPVASVERLIIAPEGLSRFYLTGAEGFHGADTPVGSTWMTREDRSNEITDYVAYLDALYDQVFGAIDRAKVTVTVLGFSQGGATANRWVTQGHALADRLIMWGCLLASDSDLGAAATFFRKVELQIVYGTRDKFADTGMIADYENLLVENDIPYRLTTFVGGHRMDRETLRTLAGSELPVA